MTSESVLKLATTYCQTTKSPCNSEMISIGILLSATMVPRGSHGSGWISPVLFHGLEPLAMQHLPGRGTDCYPSRHQSLLQMGKSGRGIWPTVEGSEIRQLVYSLQMIPQNLKRFQPNIKASWSKALRFLQTEFLLNSSFQTEVQFFWTFFSDKYLGSSALYLYLGVKQMSNLLPGHNAIFWLELMIVQWHLLWNQ